MDEVREATRRCPTFAAVANERKKAIKYRDYEMTGCQWDEDTFLEAVTVQNLHGDGGLAALEERPCDESTFDHVAKYRVLELKTLLLPV